MAQEVLDVLIIGAGLSGIGVARYLKHRCPDKSFAILERRKAIGGTWDLFRYPGIRSDSDMHTMGYAFKPWKHAKAISDGHLIREYVEETAEENGLTPLIRFEHRVLSAVYDSADNLWTLTCATPEGETVIRTRFLFMAAGYYKYDRGYLPDFAGYEDFTGTIIHPQHWPQDYDHAGRRIAIIGSGATAVTLLPTLAETAAHVVQVQRSPTYIATRPSVDVWGNRLKRFFPGRTGYSLARWRIIFRGALMRRKFAKDIKAARRMLIGLVGKQLGGKVPDWQTHFTPKYMPWQQRLCLVPDGDMFAALRSGKAEIVTGDIERFTPTGILMTDGRQVEVDTIVTATGLDLDHFGGMRMEVDGQRVEPGRQLMYKSMMYANIPNLVYFRGYTNASWTLKVDLVAEFACRLLKFMDRNGYAQVRAPATSGDFAKIDTSTPFTSGYVLRAKARSPKSGTEAPWLAKQDYMHDRKVLRRGRIDDGTLKFATKAERVVFPPEQQAGSAPAELAAE
ncbi:NAD(P)/FAD-dependent oxidoreductase [Oceanicola sp. 22II-s10i]|uniref:flavin-containing monooxygenase n=1 Tax=Oceanicola sp. 22II-s10i TaxID=1317116 RepID=UPI000B525F59|nr:NAD(P)/FAD-dependent oxidoreductase [Oceanicola sp. 22II-s10i]